MKIDVMTLDGKTEGSVELSKDVFGAPVRKDLLHRAILWQQARRRAGTADTKGRSEINATKKKLYRQKGTGGARHGAKSANIFRGGGIVFGPTPRSFAFKMTKKVRALALKTALSSKMADKKVVVLNEAVTKTHKTKDLSVQLNKLDLTNALFVVDSMNENFERASRNIPLIKVLPTEGVNVFDIMKADKLVLTKAAVAMLEVNVQTRISGEAK